MYEISEDYKEWWPYTAEEETVKVSPFRKAKVLDIIIDWHRRNQLQSETIAYNLDRIHWLLENPDRDYEDYDDLTADDFSAETRSEGFEYLDSEFDDSEDYGVGPTWM